MFRTKPKAAAVSIASNSLLILLKLVAGLLTGSISLIAEAIHSLMDLAAAIIAFFSVLISDRPADEQHPFGHGKFENISGVAEGVLIFVAAALIINMAVKKLISGVSLELLEVGIGVMAVSIVVNVIVSRYLLRVARATDSLALEADARHLTTDVMTMAGILVTLGVIRLTGLNILDPIVAMLVACLIIKTAYDITKKSFGGLIDTRLPKEEEAEIISCIKEYGYELAGFHKLRTRKSGSWRFIDMHLVVPKSASIEEAHQLCDELGQHVEKCVAYSNVIIHCEPCNEECEQCPLTCNKVR